MHILDMYHKLVVVSVEFLVTHLYPIKTSQYLCELHLRFRYLFNVLISDKVPVSLKLKFVSPEKHGGVGGTVVIMKKELIDSIERPEGPE